MIELQVQILQFIGRIIVGVLCWCILFLSSDVLSYHIIVSSGYLPNCPEAIFAMLATASIGAIWSSTSPDFGADGVLSRFQQVSLINDKFRIHLGMIVSHSFPYSINLPFSDWTKASLLRKRRRLQWKNTQSSRKSQQRPKGDRLGLGMLAIFTTIWCPCGTFSFKPSIPFCCPES